MALVAESLQQTALGGTAGPPGPPGPAGTTKCVLGFGNGSGGVNIATRFFNPWFSQQTAPLTESFSRAPFPGTLKNLMVQSRTAGTHALIITVRVNGVNTAITTTLAAGATQASDLINTAAVVQGDRVSVSVSRAVNGGIDHTDIEVTMEFDG